MTVIQRLRWGMSRIGFYRPKPGDVVLDKYDRCEKTVERVDDQRVHVVFFVGDNPRRGALMRRSVALVR